MGILQARILDWVAMPSSRGSFQPRNHNQVSLVPHCRWILYCLSHQGSPPKGWALKNWCFWTVGLEKPLEHPLDSKEIKPVNPKGNQPWIFIGRIDAEAEVPSSALATWCEKQTNWKRPWCWERLKAREGGDRGWDGWMVSPTQRTQVWASSRRLWRTGKPDVLLFMGSQNVGHNWATQQATTNLEIL